MSLTKEQKIDAAVAVVEERAREALAESEDGFSSSALRRNEYTEADDIVTALRERGVISHDGHGSRDWRTAEAARKSLVGQVKRLLDAEAGKDDGRILRFSSRGSADMLPRLDGHRRGLHGQGVGYTTPELYERALMAVQARVDAERIEQEEMDELLQRAEAAGLAKPVKADRTAVTYSRAALRDLLALLDRFDR